MILELFIVLIGISFGCLFLGHFTADKVYAVVGLGLLFLLGVVLITSSVEVQTGLTVSTSGGNATVTNVYTNFSDSNSHWFGWLLSSLALGGFVFIFVGNFGKNDLKGRRIE